MLYINLPHNVISKTDKVCRNAIAGKREGMSTEQLHQKPLVRADRFSATSHATYSTQGTETKNYKKIKQTQLAPTGVSVTLQNTLYTINSITYTVNYTLYTVPHILCTIHYKQYPIY